MQFEVGIPKILALASVFLSLLAQGASAAAPQVGSRPSGRVEGFRGWHGQYDGLAVYASGFFLTLGVVLIVLDAVMISHRSRSTKGPERAEAAAAPGAEEEDTPTPHSAWKDVAKAIRVDVHASQFGAALKRWREAASLDVPCPVDILRLLLQGAVDLGPVREVLAYVQRFPTYDRTTVLNMLLKATADVKASARGSMQGALKEYQAALEAPTNQATYEAILLGTCEEAGNTAGMEQAVCDVREYGPLKPNLCVAVVNAYTRWSLLERCVDFIEKEQFVMPKHHVREFLGKASAERSAASALGLAKRLSDLRGSRVETEEFLSAIVHRHAKAMNPDACRETMELARSLGLGLGYTAMEGAIRAYASASRDQALGLFEEFVAAYPKVKEGTCVSIIGSCAQPRFVALAEKVYAFRRRSCAGSGQGVRCSITVYASMMRVYSQAQRFQDACNVYHQAESDGVQPDARMRACYEDFAARSGGHRPRRPSFGGDSDGSSRSSSASGGSTPRPGQFLARSAKSSSSGGSSPPWRKTAPLH